MATSIDLEIEIVKTTKDKDAILSQNFVYNYKNTNKDNSKHYVCNQPGCYSSITILNGEVKKVKGQKICTNDLRLSHDKHGPYKAEEIIGMNFMKVLKNRHGDGDGTFSVVPDGFYQLYIIQGLYKSNMLPCVFSLLTGKSEEIYRKLILELKDGA
jgi:hypothetical protein